MISAGRNRSSSAQQSSVALDLGGFEIAGGEINEREAETFSRAEIAARKLFRSATSIRSSKCVPGERI